jgi:tRNA 2-thiouridine synthesizing protein E
MASDAGNGMRYRVDVHGFLEKPSDWDEAFAVTNAPAVGITSGLTEDHWRVILYIRNAYEDSGRVPAGFVTCISNHLRLTDLKRLFPAGYHRGACRLAGVSYWAALTHHHADPDTRANDRAPGRAYRTDPLGFLVDPDDWDEHFAVGKAMELRMDGGLTDRHWQIIRYLRRSTIGEGVVPTLYQTCEDNDMDLDELMRLFPDGYHRGAVKLAGLSFY